MKKGEVGLMLVGTIELHKNVFYIYMEEKQDKVDLCIVLTDGKNIRLLKQNEAKFLIKTLLSSKIEYKDNKNGFDIYIDESGNQRFYKNGSENYIMFFYNNGVSAILNKLKNDEDNKNIKDKVKRFTITVGAFVFGLTVSSVAFEVYQRYSETGNCIKYSLENDIAGQVKPLEGTVDLNVCKELIYSSESLSQEEKDFLYNEDLLIDVLAISQPYCRDFELRNKLSNISIKTFSIKDEPEHVGYYNPLIQNEINMADCLLNNKDKYRDTLAHEYIHLLQRNNEYYYIREACAEIFSNEYMDTQLDSYRNEVSNVKVLTELIGPKAIFECNFACDASGLEKSIKKYLESEDADRLLTLLKTKPADFSEEINIEVKVLLEKLYNSIDDIEKPSEKMIEKIYNGQSTNRIYFNQSKDGYAKDFVLTSNTKSIEKTKLNNINYSNIEKCTYLKENKIQLEEFKKLLDSDGNLDSDIYENNMIYQDWKIIKDGVVREVNDGYIYYVYNGSKYLTNSAIENGLIEQCMCVFKKCEITDFDKFDDEKDFLNKIQALCYEKSISHIKFYYKDGTIGQICNLNQDNIYVERFSVEETTEPSIKERFGFEIKRCFYREIACDENNIEER